MGNKVLDRIKGHPHPTEGTVYTILFTMGLCHLLNDMIQSVIPAMYPLLKDKFGFTFAQIGIITLVFQLTSSVFQPFVGHYADKHPQPYSLAAGMCFTLIGLVALAFAPDFGFLLLSVALIGCGSSVFHPEASRVAQMASGGKKKSGSVDFSGWRERRKRRRPSTCRHHRDSFRSTCRRMVRHCSIGRRRPVGPCRCMVQHDTRLLENVKGTAAIVRSHISGKDCKNGIGHAVPEPLLDDCNVCDYRTCHSIGIFCNRGLCHGSHAGQGRDDSRGIFRTHVRVGRYRFGVFRLACRFHEYRVHFPCKHMAAIARDCRPVPA